MRHSFFSPLIAVGLRIVTIVGVLCLLCWPGEIAAQPFPVTTFVQVSGFSPYPEDYTDPGRTVVTLISTDERPQYPALLRIRISGSGFTAFTKPTFLPPPLLLQRNVPLVLTGPQLSEYFNPDHLDFVGLSYDNLVKNGGAFPEGPLSVCVEVYDYNRFNDPPVSNQGCAQGILQLHRPPLLIEPIGTQTPFLPQQLRFFWQPQHAGFPTRYTLEVYEKNLDFANNIVIDATPPHLVIETFATDYLYTNRDPLLIQGKTYVVRLRAQDVLGLQRFQNNGYSEIYEFRYGQDCPLITSLSANSPNPQRIDLNWQLTQTATENFQLRYYPLAAPEEIIELSPSANVLAYAIDSLIADTEYQFELCVPCTDGSILCEGTLLRTLSIDQCLPPTLPEWQPLNDSMAFVTWTPSSVGNYPQTLTWELIPALLPSSSKRPAPKSLPERQPPNPRERGEEPASDRPDGVGLPNDDLGVPPVSYTVALDPQTRSFSLPNLQSGQRYRVTICTDCADKEDDLCTSLIIPFAGGPDDSCLAAIDFTRTDSTDTQLTLAWTIDESAANNTPADFTLIWQLANGSAPADSVVLPYQDGSYTISDLLPKRAYLLQVCTECTSGQPVCRDLAPIGGCLGPTSLSLVNISPPHVLLNWDSVALDAPVQLAYQAQFAGSWTDVSTGDLQFFDSGQYPVQLPEVAEILQLQYGLNYQARIRSLCRDSLWSDWSAPLAFNLDCQAPQTLSVSQISDTSAILHSPVVPLATQYVFEYRIQGDADWQTLATATQAAVPLKGLLADTHYEVRMRYLCSLGPWSDYSPIIVFETLIACDPPLSIQVDDTGIHHARLSWTPFVAAPTSQLRYRLLSGAIPSVKAPSAPARRAETVPQTPFPANRDAPGQTAPPKASTADSNPTSNDGWISLTSDLDTALLQQLTGGSSYQYQMRSDCQENISAWTLTATFNTDCAPPTKLLVDSVDYQTAWLHCNAATSATAYEFSYRPQGDSVWLSVSSAVTQAVLPDLIDLTTYEVRVRTRCVSGDWSVYSDPVVFTTAIKCLTPTALAASELRPFSALLTWDTTGRMAQWEVFLRDLNAPPIAVQMQSTPLGRAEGTVDEGGMGTDQRSAASGPAAPPAPDPFLAWQRFTVTEARLALSGLSDNNNYRAMVRGYCDGFGWTDTSDTIEFRTLADCRFPDTSFVDQLLETTARINWSAQAYAQTYRVHLRSLVPVPVTSGIQTFQQQSQQRTTDGESSSGNSSAGGNANTALVIYTDSVTVSDVSVDWSGLYPGTEYAYRIQTQCDNYGWTDYTAEQVFRTDQCLSPTDIVEEPIDRTSYRLSWTPSLGENTYEVRYRLLNTPGAVWAAVTTPNAFIELTDLLSGSMYEYEIGEMCKSGSIRYAELDTFRLTRPSLNNGLYACGLPLDQIDLSNVVPLPTLVAGDTIIAGDFLVIISEASGGGGTFSGAGYVPIPYFNMAKFEFSFDNIFVNDSLRVVSGYLQATGFGVEILTDEQDSLLAGMLQVFQLIDNYLFDEQSEMLQDLLDSGQLPDSLAQQAQDVLDCLANAQTQAEIDACNQLFENLMAQINEQLVEVLYNADYQTEFLANAEQDYGFDKPTYPAHDNLYTQRNISGEDYKVPWKSIQSGGEDVVDALVPEGEDADDLIFSTINNPNLPTIYGDRDATVSLSGSTHEAVIKVFASLEQVDSISGDTVPRISGELNVISYDEKPVQIVLVPVGNASLPYNLAAVQDSLRAIYRQAVVRPTVSVESALSVPSYTGPLAAVGSGLLSNYTDQMRDIIQARRNAQPALDDDTYYVFLLPTTESSSRLGFMPKQRQFGFLYLDNIPNENTFVRVLAHEIGHGAFVLEHSFETYSELDPGSTDNLMDNGGGTRLHKYQWDRVHNPGNHWSLFDGDAEGADILMVAAEESTEDITTSAEWTLIEAGTVFYTPAGKTAIVGVDIHAYFNTTYGNGVVQKFIYDNIEFSAFITKQKDSAPTATRWFRGYIPTGLYGTETGEIVRNVTPVAESEIIINNNGGYFPLHVSSIDAPAIAKAYAVNTDLTPIPGCYCLHLFKNVEVHTTFTGVRVQDQSVLPWAEHFADDDYSIYSLCPNSCDQILNEVAGVGGHLYHQLKPFVAEERRGDLLEMCQYVNGQISTEGTFAFYGHGLENSGVLTYFTHDVINFFKQNQIFDKPTFKEFYPFDTDFAKNCEVIFSTVELRHDVPSNYNELSIDYILTDFDSDTKVRYEYAFKDVYVRHEYRGSVFFTAIVNLETAKRAGPISNSEYYPQYVWVYKTNSAAYSWLSYFFNTVSDVYDPILAGQIARRLYTTLFDQATSSVGKFNKLSEAVSLIKTNLNQADQITAFISTLDNTAFRQLVGNLDNASNLITTMSLNGESMVIRSLRNTVGNSADFIEVARVTTHNGQKSLKLTDEALQPLSGSSVVDNLPYNNVDVIDANNQYLSNVKMHRLDDGRVYFSGLADDIKTVVRSKGGTNDLVRQVKNLDTPEKRTAFLNFFNNLDNTNVNKFNASAALTGEGMVGAWGRLFQLNANPILRDNISIIESLDKLVKHDLLINLGSATDNHIANLHRYTAHGDYLNNPMRGPYTDLPRTIPPITLGTFEKASYDQIIESMLRLRQTNRLYQDYVFRGRTFSLEHYNNLFATGDPMVPLKGFQSASTDIGVAEHFLSKTANFPGPKAKVIMKIRSKNGVYIDDLSDYGETLGPIYHGEAPQIEQIQREVLMEEGMFLQIGAPQPVLENGVPKVTIENNEEVIWMVVELEELGQAIRPIN